MLFIMIWTFREHVTRWTFIREHVTRWTFIREHVTR
jgi:hypothetical protein